MINAAVVGLGTWGKTMVESLASGSDLMRFTTLQTRTVTPDVEAFAKQHSLAHREQLRGRARRSQDRRRGARDPAVRPSAADRGRRGRRQARLLREAVHASPRKRPRRRWRRVRKAKRVIGVGYNRRFHPEMIKLHDRIRAGDLGTIQHIEASMTYPNALFLPPTAWRSQQDTKRRSAGSRRWACMRSTR